jgi:ribosomal-protein-alanine N-acetyltransferase
MTWGDLPEVLAIEKSVFPTPWPKSVFLHEMRYNRCATMVVAHLADRWIYPGVVGYAGFWSVAGEMHITTMAVDPHFQRRGISRQLIDHCFEMAHSLGCTEATLEVRASNVAAQRLYASYGFVLAGRRRRYYADGEDALIMTLKEL